MTTQAYLQTNCRFFLQIAVKRMKKDLIAAREKYVIIAYAKMPQFIINN
jgi:hypothetical protein